MPQVRVGFGLKGDMPRRGLSSPWDSQLYQGLPLLNAGKKQTAGCWAFARLLLDEFSLLILPVTSDHQQLSWLLLLELPLLWWLEPQSRGGGWWTSECLPVSGAAGKGRLACQVGGCRWRRRKGFKNRGPGKNRSPSCYSVLRRDSEQIPSPLWPPFSRL